MAAIAVPPVAASLKAAQPVAAIAVLPVVEIATLTAIAVPPAIAIAIPPVAEIAVPPVASIAVPPVAAIAVPQRQQEYAKVIVFIHGHLLEKQKKVLILLYFL